MFLFCRIERILKNHSIEVIIRRIFYPHSWNYAYLGADAALDLRRVQYRMMPRNDIFGEAGDAR